MQKPNPIIPPDPPPPPPAKPDEEPASVPTKPTRDPKRQSRPDVGEVRHVPRTPDPPVVIGRRSPYSTIHDARSTGVPGPGAYRGYDLLITDR